MKKVFRITEEDLHNIIKEGVNKILSELDWRTYHNAAVKDYDKNRRNKFMNMAHKLFNDKYEYNDYEKGNHMRMQGDFVNNPRLEVLTKNNDNKEKKHYIKYPEDKNYAFYTNYTSGHDKFPNLDGDKKFARKLSKAHDALNSINNKYEKGKGYIDDKPSTDFHKFLGKN